MAPSVFEVAVEPFYLAFRLQMVGRCQGVLHMAEAGKITCGGGWVSAEVSGAGAATDGLLVFLILAVSLALLRR